MNPANQQSPCQSGGWRQPTGVSAQIWDRICSEESVREDERAAAAMDHADLNWVLDNLHANSRLVDLGCGSGRLLQRHQSRGGWGLGVDLAWPALRAAKNQLGTRGQAARLIRANLVDLSCLSGAGLDAAACLFSTLGMIRGRANRLDFLSSVRKLLKPGGLLFLHAHARWWHLGTPAGRNWLVRDLGARWTGIGHVGEFRASGAPDHVPRLVHFSRWELLALVQAAGFHAKEILRVEGENHQKRPSGWFRPAHGWLIKAESSR